MKLTGMALAFIVVLFLGARLVFFDTSYFFGDEAAYVLNALALTGTDYFNELSFRPPLVSALLAPLLLFSSPELIKLFPIFLNLLVLAAVYIMGREIDHRVGLLAAALLAVFPFHIMASRWVMTDSITIAFSSLSFFFAYRALKTRHQRMAVWGGALFSLAVMTKFTSLFLLLAIVPLFIYYRKGNGKTVVWGVVSAFCVLVPYLVYTTISFGQPLLPIIQASGVAVSPDPVGWEFVTWTIVDFFPPALLALLAVSLVLAYWRPTGYRTFLVYGFLAHLLLYLYLIQKGAAKPEYIEWEVERFLLPALLFSLVLVADVMLRVAGHIQKYRGRIVALLFLMVVVSGALLYQRAYTPSLSFEQGLRGITKEAGLYLRGNAPLNSAVYCTFDCPPKAYYSQRRVVIFDRWAADRWERIPRGAYMVVSNRLPPYQEEAERAGLLLLKRFEAGGNYISVMVKP